jgi:hypothetical protein
MHNKASLQNAILKSIDITDYQLLQILTIKSIESKF